MSNLLVVAVCLFAGLALQRMRVMGEDAPRVLNLYVIYVALPALVLEALPKLQLNAEVLLPVVAAWGVMLLSLLLVWLLARALRWSKPVTAVMLLLVPLGNTSFIGFPMVEAFYGANGLPYAILYDQLGSFIAVSSYGLFVLAYYSGDSLSARAVAKKMLTFPPFIAALIAVCFIGQSFPEWLSASLTRIGASLVPVVMVAVGLQWQLKLDRAHLLPLSLALGLKLLLAPLLLWLVFRAASLDMSSLAVKVTVLEAAMPAMITAGALAVSHDLAPRLASSIVGYGLLLSLATVPLWAWVLS